MIDNNFIDIPTEMLDIGLVKKLILGDVPSQSNEKAWLFDIVANKRNSLDVDKMDYLLRDSQACGIKNISYDYQVIFDASMVLNN